jgi:hypothetical protein
MKSVPLLAAMLSDDYLLPWPMEALRGMAHYPWSSYDSDSSPEETADRVFRQLNRPARRSDVARELLAPLLPAGEDSGEGIAELPADRLREDVMAWYAGKKDALPDELAMSYVEHGDGAFQRRCHPRHRGAVGADGCGAGERPGRARQEGNLRRSAEMGPGQHTVCV